MSLDNSVLGYELQAATTMGTMWHQAKDTFLGRYFFMRTIYLYSEIDALHDEDVVQLCELSGTNARAVQAAELVLLAGLSSEGECETAPHYSRVEPSIVSTNQGRLLYLAQVKRPRQH